MKKLLALIISVSLLLSLTFQVSAATSTKAKAVAPPKAVKLTFMFFGDKPVGMDAVLAEFEKKTKNTLNMKIAMSFTPFGDFKNKVNLKLAAGEPVDAVFDAPWWGMPDMISKGNYQKLDKYFLSDKYPGLKKAFSKEFVENNKFFGNVYGIPFAQGYKEVNGFFIRKDLREKYGMDKISNINDLEEYFDNVKKYNGDMIPLADDGAAMRWAYGYTIQNDAWGLSQHVVPVLIGQIWAGAKLSNDNSRVLSMEMNGSLTKPKLGIPYDTAAISARWKAEGYFEKDVLTQQNSLGLFMAGKAASVAHGISRMPILVPGLASAVKGGKVEFFISNDNERTLAPKTMVTDFKTSNYACIPVSSKNADAVMKFYDHLFSNRDIHDLFELGIQGKDWIAAGFTKYRLVNGSKYAFPGYEMTWNSSMIRQMDGMDPDYYAIEDYIMKDSSYYQNALSGFSFNSEPVKNELLKVTDVAIAVSQIQASGIYGADTYKKAHEEYLKGVDLGYDKISAEAKKQIADFLKKKK